MSGHNCGRYSVAGTWRVRQKFTPLASSAQLTLTSDPGPLGQGQSHDHGDAHGDHPAHQHVQIRVQVQEDIHGDGHYRTAGNDHVWAHSGHVGR